ncbi:bifunctional riboflavin kinase/FAD synthetase [Flavobacteriaceae bacterium TP-CH-4]|uniref:Riboflavin biosynthesis protein n=1 Tax=Pelagihabitans pacificus TaxID=2696054 RepID=A0A967AVD1_9FLAO|nr:bifunctional riboflavin kinase/FAD synthetase [Pelagihabitans pacificus]NHF60637.1 bifunctional riboflavin kinase/FAD synthetase [Pelagihabitans pacificus]
METVQSISKYDEQHSTAVTIGTFDGVHIGHRTILERLIAEARNLGIKSTVLTFFPHPRMVLQKDSDIKLLNTIEEKSRILDELGLDYLVVHPFTKEFSRLTATEFVRDILVNKLKTKKIIIGYDHRFGRNRTANIVDLKAFGNALDFEVEEIPAQEVDAVSVSSTKIRKALEIGDMVTANKFLGYAYMLTGVVRKGRGLGRQLNFPTANLQIEASYKLIPKNGVYVVSSVIEGKTIFGMMNIGHNPTVSNIGNDTMEGQQRIEVHFFDFDKDLYGFHIQIDILERIRDEHKFDSIEALKKQLEKDRNTSLAIISK